MVSDTSQDKLREAWKKFNTRLSRIQSKAVEVLHIVEEKKKEKELEKLRQRIQQN